MSCDGPHVPQVALYIHLSIYLTIHLSFYLSIFLSIYLSIYLYTHLLIYLSIYLYRDVHLNNLYRNMEKGSFLVKWTNTNISTPVFLPPVFIYPSFFPYPIHLSIYSSIYLSIYPSIYLSIHPFIYPSIYLSIYPSI